MNIIIAGNPKHGKTTATIIIVEMLSRANIPYGGIICEEHNVKDITTEETKQFLYTEKIPDAMVAGHKYHIPYKAIEFANATIIASAKEGKLTIIDKYGHLEMRGEGIAPGLEQAMQYENNLILVREKNLEDFKSKFPEKEIKTYILTKENRDKIPEEVFTFITSKQ